MTEFSLAIYHRKDSWQRHRALRDMLDDLNSPSTRESVAAHVFDDPAEGPWNVWQHTLHPRVWQWSLDSCASHHVFMTDDLHICPAFWPILSAMVEAQPNAILGLLSNHPSAVAQANRGAHWYRCNAWIVGPAYVVPTAHLDRFLTWYRAWIETVDRSQYGDDSALNEWISREGPRESWHPLPTIIEHRGDLESTWQSGDCFSRERVSWRAHRSAPLRGDYRGLWTTEERRYDLDAMSKSTYWIGSGGPLLTVGGAREDEGANWRGDPCP